MNKIQKISSLKILLAFTAISLFGIVFISVLLSSFYVFVDEKGTGETFPSPKQYQYVRINSQHSETSSGIVSIYQDLGENDFMTYNIDDDKSQVLISNFGSPEYICTGTCTCEKREEATTSRKSSNLAVKAITRSFTTLIAAVTTLIAFNRAKDYFSEECETQLRTDPSCHTPSSTITSKVDECVMLSSDSSSTETSEEEQEEEEEQQQVKKKKSNVRRFYCTGQCQPRIFGRAVANRLTANFKCDRLKQKGPVDIPGRTKNLKKLAQIAEKEFVIRFLDKYCKAHSYREYDQVTKKGNTIVAKYYHCSGSNMKKKKNPTVKCSEVHGLE